jgi:uncharacterized protein
LKALVVLLALLLLAWLLLGSARRRGRDTHRDRTGPTDANAPVEDMVACAHCGVHLPASLALQAQGRSYCSAAHRDAGPRAP